MSAATVLSVCWGLFVLVWVVWAFRRKPEKARLPRSGRVAYALVLSVAFCLLSGRLGLGGLRWRVLPGGLVTTAAGETLLIAGLTVAVWARLCLGANWSGSVTLREGHELIDRGPYRYVRHPIYSGLLAMMVGTALILGHVGGFLGLGLGLLGFWQKLRQEERWLCGHFPAVYPAYMSRTKALVPGLL